MAFLILRRLATAPTSNVDLKLAHDRAVSLLIQAAFSSQQDLAIIQNTN